MQRPSQRFRSEEYFDSYTRYSKKCLTQIYRDLHGDAMLAPLRAKAWCHKTKNPFEAQICMKISGALMHHESKISGVGSIVLVTSFEN